jgi:hypothetical protein
LRPGSEADFGTGRTKLAARATFAPARVHVTFAGA